jgi:hypothetical protein
MWTSWASSQASFLKDLLESGKTSSEHGSEDPILAEVLSVLAYSLSMSGSLAHGMKMAREAWNKQKCVNNLVTLFHCASRYENADTLLEFDNALNELSTSDHEDILQHFPRLSNSCVENEADGGGELLLGVQERWMNLLLPQSHTLTPDSLSCFHTYTERRRRRCEAFKAGLWRQHEVGNTNVNMLLPST